MDSAFNGVDGRMTLGGSISTGYFWRFNYIFKYFKLVKLYRTTEISFSCFLFQSQTYRPTLEIVTMVAVSLLLLLLLLFL